MQLVINALTMVTLRVVPLLIVPLLIVPLLVVPAGFLPATAKGTKGVSWESAQQQLAARANCDLADIALANAMEKTRNEFSKICLKQGHFPNDKHECERIANNLQSIVAESNPYKKETILKQQVDSEFPDRTALVLIIDDPTLSENKVRFYSHEPPADWRATPGSIAIIHNEYDLFIVVGMDIDGKPIRDASSHVRILSQLLFQN